jgi:filamentous hemagglutinin family protein
MHLRWLQGVGSAIASAILLYTNHAVAQITPDTSLPNNTQVNTVDITTNITGGTQAGTNLFHSFKDFSVLKGNAAFFQNTADIQNIISRVTGGSISNIDGLIRANGTANLFLINPNGIVFGSNARLDIGGSFIGSTANSLKFADGTEFRANPDQTSPLLTISVPMGLQFGSNPGAIALQGMGHEYDYQSDIVDRINADERGLLLDTKNAGLEVLEGKTLALVGGNIFLEGAILKAPAGRVEIAAVGSNSSVSLNQVSTGWKVSGDRTATSFADIQVASQSWIGTTGVGGGEIVLTGKDIRFASESILRADTTGNKNGGGISIVGDSIEINKSNLGSYTFNLGNGGSIQLDAKIIKFENNGGVFTETQSPELRAGKAGDITFKADSIVIQNQGGAESNSFGAGNSGQINVNANSLRLENRVGFGADAFGRGNSGDITITVGEFVASISGIGTTVRGSGNTGKVNITANSLKLSNAGIGSSTTENSTGNAGGIILNIANLMTLRDASINAKSDGTGNGGKISINAKTLQIERSEVVSNTTNTGKAGEIDINADKLLLESAGIITDTQSAGKGGDININLKDLFVIQNGGGVSASASSTGDAGSINISAGNFQVEEGGIITDTQNTGKGGDININVKDLFMLQKSAVDARSSGTGGGGRINISAGNFQIEGAAIISETQSTGKGGDININVKDLFFIQESSTNTTVTASTLANGNAGEITLFADQISLNGVVSISSNVGYTSAPIVNLSFDEQNKPKITIESRQNTIVPNVVGDGGNIVIHANSVLVKNGAQLTTSNFGQGNAGNIKITTLNAAFDGKQGNTASGAFSSVEKNAVGNGGTIDITTNNLTLTNGAQLVVSNLGQGNAGNIKIQAANKLLIAGEIGQGASTGVFAESQTANGGNIALTGDLLFLRYGGLISTISRVDGLGGIDGNVDIKTQFLVAIPKENSDIIAIGSGRSPGSNIQVRSQGIFGTQIRNDQTPQSDIVATGQVTLNILDVDPNNGLVVFPIEAVDAANLINKNFCAVRGNNSSFRITGRGGLPLSPDQPLRGSAVITPWVTLAQGNDETREISEEITKQPTPEAIVEAQGWVINDQGEVKLVAAVPTVTPQDLLNSPSGCQAATTP